MKKVGVLTFWEFPDGMAPTTRILAYSKGLVNNGVEVEIFSFRRIFKCDFLKEKIQMSGDYQGVKYNYIHVFSDLGQNVKIIRVFDELILRIKLLSKVIKSHRRKPFDLFLFSFDDVNSLGAYCKLFSKFPFPKFFVADEFPIPIRDFMMEKVPEDLMRRYAYFQSFFSGRVLMSQALERFYNQNCFELPTFILNTIVDSDRFKIKPEIPSVNYICYMGNMSLKKDNVDNIIRAFSLISNKYEDLELHLYGVPNKEDRVFLENLISELNLASRVVIKGRLGNADVPNVLKSAKICVNSQPITKRAEGGFPTKLGEYLLAEVPSIFTDSGDIGIFVKDGVHTYLVMPENPKLYAEKIEYILDNYDSAKEVARHGKEFVEQNYTAGIQTANMITFFNYLKH